MAERRVERRLAAILAADVAGYSRLMGQDEEGTLGALTAHVHDLIEPCVAEHRGRVVKTTGDGVLAEFPSVVDAVGCAVALQDGMTARNADIAENRRIEFRVGVNLGDVMVQEGDVYGDGVNVAARLESLARPGGVVVSGTVHDHVKGKIDLVFEDLGPRRVKNIAEPVHALAVRRGEPATVGAMVQQAAPPPLPDKPSIAVLPFDNLSGDAEQEYFVDGIAEDIITALSHVRQFFVIARNTTFTYKGRHQDVQVVANELGVRYVLEGSVRKAGNRVRITAQLIDGETGNHIWAERYDRELEDIFAVQDEITQIVVGAIGPQLESAERSRALKVAPGNVNAWSLYHQGLHYLNYAGTRGEPADLLRAADCFERAASADPRFSRAWSGLAMGYYLASLLDVGKSRLGDSDKGLEIARRAVAMDRADSAAHWTLGAIYLIRRNSDAAIRELRLATELNPSDAMAYQVLGIALFHAGDPVAAQASTEMALRLSPRDPQSPIRLGHLAFARFHQGDFEGAIELARRAMLDPAAPYPVQSVLVSALGHLGRRSEARHELAELLRRRPDFSLRFAGDVRPYTDERSRRQYLDGLRKAGLVE